MEENCLDVSVGADDRLVIEGWIQNGADVEDEWVMQNSCPASEIAVGILSDAGGLKLSWESDLGKSYRIETSVNLITWADALSEPIAETGAILVWALPSAVEVERFHCLRLAEQPERRAVRLEGEERVSDLLGWRKSRFLRFDTPAGGLASFRFHFDGGRGRARAAGREIEQNLWQN